MVDAEQKIELYLVKLRRLLRAMNREDAGEVVRELRGHITDKATVSGELASARVEAALAAPGSPEELASQYLTDDLLSRAEMSRSPLRVLESLFRWAGLSVAGFIALLASLLGYFLGGALMWCAMLKLIHPQTAGLWRLPSAPDTFLISLRLGFGSPPAGATDLLGWWIVPLGLSVGCALVLVTTHCALWSARHWRKPHLFALLH